MSLALATLLAVSTATPATLPACSWNRPGHNPFTGDVVAAVDRYRDIPAPVRQRLKSRMASRSYDEIVSIQRDAIVGKARYSPEIRGMHFGAGQVCGTVNRLQWKTDAQERGLVYCEDGHCILVPTVCRNVSRIQREEPAVAGAGGQGPGAAGGGPAGGEGGNAPSAGTSPIDQAAAPGSFVEGQSLPSPAEVVAASTMGGGLGAGPEVDKDRQSWQDAVDLASLSRPGSWINGGGSGGGLPGGGGSGGGLPGGGGSGGGLPGGGGSGGTDPVSPVPEPGTWALMIGGLVALGWRARRAQQAASP